MVWSVYIIFNIVIYAINKSPFIGFWLKAAIIFVVVASMLLLPQLTLFQSLTHRPEFAPGWLKKNDSFWWFWFKNTGLFVPIAIIGFIKAKLNRHATIFVVASSVLFILPNILSFAPWAYDNLKILTYWYLIWSILAAVGLYNISKIKYVGELVAGLLFITLTFSGILEVSRLLDRSRTQLTLWSKSDQKLAEAVKQITDPMGVFLTAPVHDHPVVSLAGRKTIIGYPGNSWSWGLSGWQEREQDVNKMYIADKEAQKLWKKYNVSYIAITQRENSYVSDEAIESIKKKAKLIIDLPEGKVYKIK